MSRLDEPRFPRNELDGLDDTADYHAFQIARPATVGLGLRQLDFDADLYLEGLGAFRGRR